MGGRLPVAEKNPSARCEQGNQPATWQRGGTEALHLAALERMEAEARLGYSWPVLRRALLAYPTLLKVGFADAIAYRVEFLIWILTTNMPLVMLALWGAVARE